MCVYMFSDVFCSVLSSVRNIFVMGIATCLFGGVHILSMELDQEPQARPLVLDFSSLV